MNNFGDGISGVIADSKISHVRAQHSFDVRVRVQLCNLKGEECDAGQQLFDNKFVGAAQVTALGLLQLRDFGTQLAFGQLCQMLHEMVGGNYRRQRAR